MFNILFFIQADKFTGMGHFFRSAELMRVARLQGHNCKVVVRSDYNLNTDDVLKTENPVYLDWFRKDLLENLFNGESFISVIDSYNVPDLIIDELIMKSIRVMIILDFGYPDRENVLYLIPSGFDQNKINYIARNNNLIGGQYSIIRRLFTEIKVKNNSSLKKVILYLGSNPSHELVTSIINVINSNFSDNLYNVTILKSTSSLWDDDILRIKNVKLINNPGDSDISEEFSDCTFVITNLGQSSLEVQFLKLPAIFIMTADNQKNNYDLLTNNGLMTLPIFDDWNNMYFTNLLSDKIYDLLSNKYQSIINDERINNAIEGSSNIVRQLVNIGNEIELRFAELNDSRFLYDLHNDTSVREQSFNNKKTTIYEHETWFTNSLSDVEKQIFIIFNRELKLGQIRLDYSNATATISISIDQKYRGLGVAKLALKNLLNNPNLFKPSITKLLAFVKLDNIASRKLFQSLGFVEDILDDRIRFTMEVGKVV